MEKLDNIMINTHFANFSINCFCQLRAEGTAKYLPAKHQFAMDHQRSGKP